MRCGAKLFFGLFTLLILSTSILGQCPSVSVTCPTETDEDVHTTFTANFTHGTLRISETYKWKVSAGTISSGQGTSSITVDTTGLGGQLLTARVEVGGIDSACKRTASCSTPVRPRPDSGREKFDEYGDIRFNDEKARLDNFAIQLQNEPTATGYMIGYGNCAGEGMARVRRAKHYLVNTRGLKAGRLNTLDGGCLPNLIVQLFIVPQGATPPTGDAVGTISPCPNCEKKPATRKARQIAPPLA